MEWMAIAVLTFVFLLVAIIGSYRFFIVGRAKSSPEYRTAEYYVRHSLSVLENLSSPIARLKFDDIRVDERADYGVCELKFSATLEDGAAARFKVGLVKVADFWLVYSAVLNPGTGGKKRLLNTYEKIIMLLEEIDFDNYTVAKTYLPQLLDEILGDPLKDYLMATVVARDEPERALSLLKDLEGRVRHSKLAVLFQEAQIHYERRNFASAIDVLLKMEWVYEHETAAREEEILAGIFAGLPKSPFLANLDPDNVMASARKLLSLSFSSIGQYAESLHWADRAVEQADKIRSMVVRSSSLYLKALSLYDLEQFAVADRAFAEVIADIDNPNLSQKSWAYFFRAEIAARGQRHQDSLDFYEVAVTLEPTNALVREGAIDYLMKRGFVGDLEVALGLAIRGIDYGVERPKFVQLASALYKRMGLPDQTLKMGM